MSSFILKPVKVQALAGARLDTFIKEVLEFSQTNSVRVYASFNNHMVQIDTEDTELLVHSKFFEKINRACEN